MKLIQTINKLSVKILRTSAYLLGAFFLLGSIINFFTVTQLSDALLLLFIGIPMGLFSLIFLNGFAIILENNMKEVSKWRQ